MHEQAYSVWLSLWLRGIINVFDGHQSFQKKFGIEAVLSRIYLIDPS